MARDPEKVRQSSKRYRDKHRKPRVKDAADFDQFEYRAVHESWRWVVSDVKRDFYETEITSKLVKDLLAGKTLLVDYPMKYGQRTHPYRTLYSYFTNRGMKLRIHIVDDPAKEKYRILLMWTEKLNTNYREIRKAAKAA